MIHLRIRRRKMKYTKNALKDTLLVTTAALAAGLLASLCSGCDGSGGEEVASGDAGRADSGGSVKADAGRSDVVKVDAVTSDGVVGSMVAPCQVPTPKLAMTGVSSTPRLGYVVLHSDVGSGCSADPSNNLDPASCDDPVDGFASSLSGNQWCCVNVQDNGTSLINSQHPWMCIPAIPNVKLGSETSMPGDVAVCSSSGVFVGWACQGDNLEPVLTTRTAPVVTRATSCQVPTPKFSLNGTVSATPRGGYLIVEVESVPCLTTIAGVSQPTNCADPVDGFASGLDQSWFRIAFQKVGSAYYLAPGYLIPVATGKQIMDGAVTQSPFGNVALCSPSGKFLGW
jgi:hypothetical protein